jgi:hypothetical protein
MSLFNKFCHTAHCSCKQSQHRPLKVVLEIYDFLGVGHKCCKIGPQLFPTTLHLVICISNLWYYCCLAVFLIMSYCHGQISLAKTSKTVIFSCQTQSIMTSSHAFFTCLRLFGIVTSLLLMQVF